MADRKGIDMQDVTATCACGRVMAPVNSLGPGNFRCSACRTRIHITIPHVDRNPFRCTIAHGTKRCTHGKAFGFDICEMHLKSTLSRVLDDDERRTELAEDIGEKEMAATDAELRRRYQLRREENLRALQQMRPDCPVVYYVLLAEHNIKIGTTIHLPQRMDGLRVIHREQVLAAEPGGRKLERQRHKQFAHLRYHPLREDFRPADDLIGHINSVRAEHGHPYEMAERMLAEARKVLLAESDNHQ